MCECMCVCVYVYVCIFLIGGFCFVSVYVCVSMYFVCISCISCFGLLCYCVFVFV